jgi:hypothetical protein
MTGMPDFSAAAQPDSGAAGSEPVSAAAEPARHFWLAVLLLAAVLGFFAIRSHWVPNKWLFGDGAFYMNVARGLLENGSLRQEAMHPHSWYEQDLGWNRDVDAAWSNIALGRNGEWWPKHPILMPIVAAPFVWAFGPIGTLVFQFVFFLGMALLAYRIAARVAPRPAALAAACAFLATPWIYDRVWGFNNDVFYTVLIMAALDAALGRRAVLAGALLGIGVFAKATNVFYGPGLLALFLLRKDWRGALRFCVAAAVPAVIYLGANWYMYASPFKTGYDRILVREAGKLGMHSHSADFHFANMLPGIRRVLFGAEGFLGKVPLFFAALAGLLPLAFRRWREALVLAWCLAVPIAFHAVYTWYRLEFNLPQLAMAVAPLAALLSPLGAPFEEEFQRRRVRWGRLAAVALAFVLLAAGLVRRATAPQGDYFWQNLPRAEVKLGEAWCDYYNNQMERWECSHFDNNDWFMTGRPLGTRFTFDGEEAGLLVFHPHPSKKERTLSYREVPLSAKLKVRYGLADGSRGDALVDFRVLIDGDEVFAEQVRGRGLRVTDLDTSRWAGSKARVTFVVTAPAPDWCLFGVGGGPEI